MDADRGVSGPHLAQSRIQFGLQFFEGEKIFQFGEKLPAERACQPKLIKLAFEEALLIGRIRYLLRLDQKGRRLVQAHLVLRIDHAGPKGDR